MPAADGRCARQIRCAAGLKHQAISLKMMTWRSPVRHEAATRAARQAILSAVTRANDSTTYWLDFGNNASSGQYVLGQPLNAANRRSAARLRTVAELYPEIVDAEAGEDPLPSCSAAEALERQEPFINQVLATSALAVLARLFRYGTLTHHGAFYNAQTGRMAALPVDPRMWERMRRRDRRANQKF